MPEPAAGVPPLAQSRGQATGGALREPAGARRGFPGRRDDRDQTQITLNGFNVEVRPGWFTAFVRDLPDASELEQLRVSAGDRRALWWRKGVLYEVPRVQGAVRAAADEKTPVPC